MGEERESIEEMVLYWDERGGKRRETENFSRGFGAKLTLVSPRGHRRAGVVGPTGKSQDSLLAPPLAFPPPQTSETGGPTCSGAQQQQRPRCAGAAVRAEGSDGGRRRSHRGDVADRWGPLASAVRVGWTDSSCRFFRWWCWW